MTTTVTVSAHCDPKTTEVHAVMLTPFSRGEITDVMQDGSVKDFHVYDGRTVVVREVAKVLLGVDFGT